MTRKLSTVAVPDVNEMRLTLWRASATAETSTSITSFAPIFTITDVTPACSSTSDSKRSTPARPVIVAIFPTPS